MREDGLDDFCNQASMLHSSSPHVSRWFHNLCVNVSCSCEMPDVVSHQAGRISSDDDSVYEFPFCLVYSRWIAEWQHCRFGALVTGLNLDAGGYCLSWWSIIIHAFVRPASNLELPFQSANRVPGFLAGSTVDSIHDWYVCSCRSLHVEIELFACTVAVYTFWIPLYRTCKHKATPFSRALPCLLLDSLFVCACGFAELHLWTT